MDFDALRERQHGNFSTWQLGRVGWTRGQIRAARRGTREVHDGVHLTGDGPLTPHQRWWAAVLTTPATWLSDESAGALYRFIEDEGDWTTVTRRGSGSIEDYGTLRVRRSLWLPPEDVGEVGGLPALSPARTVLDLVARRGEFSGRRLVRTAMRVEAVTGNDLWMVLARHTGRAAASAACARMRRTTRTCPSTRPSAIPKRSDWPSSTPSPNFPPPRRDARKQAVWESRGWDVRRLPTQAVYDRPDRLIALAPRPAR